MKDSNPNVENNDKVKNSDITAQTKNISNPKSRAKKVTKWALLSVASIIVLVILAILIVMAVLYNGIYESPDFKPRDFSYVRPGAPGDIEDISDQSDFSYGEDISTDAGADLSTPIYIVEPKNENILNILLIGRDVNESSGSNGRSDSMMLLTYNKESGDVKLTSFLRDSLVPIADYGWSRLNATYSWGGVGLTINTLNEIYDLDIQYYVSIDYSGFTSVIDSIDGVTVNLTKAEAQYLNKNNGFNFSAGDVTLNGKQALAYSRIRKIDSDWNRTDRQRKVITSVMNKALNMNDTGKVVSLIADGLKYVKTNLKSGDIFNLARNFLSMDNYNVDATAIPTEGTWSYGKYKGMSIIKIDFDKNIDFLKKRIYGE